MHKMRDIGGDLLRPIAWIRPRRGRQRGLLDQVTEIKVTLGASADTVKGIGSILVADVAVEITALRIHSFEDGPAKIHAGSNADIQILPGVPTDITDIEHTGIPVGPIVTAGAGAQGHAAWISQSKRPDTRRRRSRLRRIIPRIARHTVTGGWIQPEDLTVQGIRSEERRGGEECRSRW